MFELGSDWDVGTSRASAVQTVKRVELISLFAAAWAPLCLLSPVSHLFVTPTNTSWSPQAKEVAPRAEPEQRGWDSAGVQLLPATHYSAELIHATGQHQVNKGNFPAPLIPFYFCLGTLCHLVLVEVVEGIKEACPAVDQGENPCRWLAVCLRSDMRRESHTVEGRRSWFLGGVWCIMRISISLCDQCYYSCRHFRCVHSFPLPQVSGSQLHK